MSLNEVQLTRMFIGLLGIVLVILSPSILVYIWRNQHRPFKGIFISIGVLIFGIGFFLTFLTWGY